MYLLVSFIFLTIGTLIVVFSTTIVRWQAQNYRQGFRRSFGGKVPEDYQRLVGLIAPWNRFLIGSLQDFIDRGVEDPRSFPRYVWAIRIIGVIGGLVPGFASLIYFFVFVSRSAS